MNPGVSTFSAMNRRNCKLSTTENATRRSRALWFNYSCLNFIVYQLLLSSLLWHSRLHAAPGRSVVILSWYLCPAMNDRRRCCAFWDLDTWQRHSKDDIVSVSSSVFEWVTLDLVLTVYMGRCLAVYAVPFVALLTVTRFLPSILPLDGARAVVTTTRW